MTQHEVTTAYERGWSTLSNGEVLDAAEKDGYAVLSTTDSNLRYQQNLGRRRIAVIVLSTPSWPRIQRASASVLQAIERATPGSYAEVAVP